MEIQNKCNLALTNLTVYSITKCLPDWVVDDEYTTHYRLYYIYSGEACYKSKETTLMLKKGSLYLFPIHRAYSIEHNKDDPLKCLWFHFGMNKNLMNDVIETDVKSSSALVHLIKSAEILLRSKARNNYARAIKNSQEQYNVYEIIFKLLDTIISVIEVECSGELFVLDDIRLKGVIEYIHDKYNTNISNKELASIVNLDQRYFIRLFKKSYLQTPQSYILAYRIFKASNFLNGGFSVAQVSEKVGFSDSKAFSRAFKRMKGITPSEFKKSYFQQP